MSKYVIYRFYVTDPQTNHELNYIGYFSVKVSWTGNPAIISGPGGSKFLSAGSKKYGPVKSKMANAIKKYGWSNFKFQVLDQTTVKQNAENLKWKYIQQFNSMAEGLNILRSGGNGSPREKKPVEQYTKDGVFIKEYASMKEAELALGIYRGSISNVIRGNKKTAGGYVWKLKKI